jgi:hypothetical protein
VDCEIGCFAAPFPDTMTRESMKIQFLPRKITFSALSHFHALAGSITFVAAPIGHYLFAKQSASILIQVFWERSPYISRRVVGIDMETYGVFYAANNC